MDFLTEPEARRLVESYMSLERSSPSTQAILDSGAIPRLRDYIVRPGKVSDSIFGGKGSYFVKQDGKLVEIKFENSPLETPDRIPLRLMVRTERISTHDINRGEIPFKDQILGVNHNFMVRLVRDVLGTSQFDVEGLEDSSVVIAAENLNPFQFENVLRAYMAKSTTSTSLYQAWLRKEERFSGHLIPEGLIPNGPLPYIMDTPSTKSEVRDETVDRIYLAMNGFCTHEEYDQMRNAGLVAFGIVTQFLREKGLILVDTKTEHGRNRKDQIVSQDELYTIDSSRFWLRKDYEGQLERLARGEIKELYPISYSKEFARGMAEGENGFTEEQRIQIAVRYIMAIQHLTGTRFVPDIRSREERVIYGLRTALEKLVA